MNVQSILSTSIRDEQIQAMSHLLQELPGTEALVLIGSRARNDTTPNSDWDFLLLVNQNFNPQATVDALRDFFGPLAQQALLVRLRSNMTIYPTAGPRIEINYYDSLRGLERNFMGSQVPAERIPACVLFDRQPGRVADYLAQISRPAYEDEHFNLEALINKFAYEFENGSSNHRRSDAYRFYFHYNIALHIAVQLAELVREHPEHPYLPKGFFRRYFEPKETEQGCKRLSASLWLADGNAKKRHLLDFLFRSLDQLTARQALSADYACSIRNFLEWVYARDFFWNLRDISKFNPTIKPKRILRSSSLTLIQDHPMVREIVTQYGVSDLIDLRAADEVETSSYQPAFLQGLRYHHLPIDPTQQSRAFQEKHTQNGTHVEIAYRYFALECREQIAQMMRALIEAEGATLIHCHAGKDRTGALVTLLHLLSPAPYAVWIKDYLASEMDTNPDHLNAFLEIIEAEGGIQNYLLNCGLSESEIIILKSKLFEA